MFTHVLTTVLAFWLPKTSIEDCSVSLCHWEPWESWSSCSQTCGGGSQSRSREICCRDHWTTSTCLGHCRKSNSGFHEETKCGEICYHGGSLSGWGCRCTVWYYGYCCQYLNACFSQPCKHDGHCINQGNDFLCMCKPGYETKVCDLDCRPGPTDVIFLLDTSHSERNGFNQSINYIKQFIEQVPVSQKDFAFSIISYSFEPRLEFDFDDHVNKSSLLSAISTIVPVSGATYTAKALEKAFEVLWKSSYGVRVTGTPKFVIVLSDGLSTDRNKINEARMKLNSFNMRIMAVGVGEQVDHKELLQIASSPAYVFSPESNDAFNRVMLESVGDDCQVCLNSSSADVFIFFDTSYDHHEQFHEALDAQASLITILNIESTDINVGLASFDENIDILISLNESKTTDKLQTEMQTIKISRQPSDVSKVLNYTRETLFKDTNGIRENARKVIILFSNGHWENKERIKEEIIFCQRENITVVFIATSIDADLEAMFKVASTQHNIIYVDSMQNKNNLKSIISYINYLKCQDNLFV